MCNFSMFFSPVPIVSINYSSFPCIFSIPRLSSFTTAYINPCYMGPDALSILGWLANLGAFPYDWSLYICCADIGLLHQAKDG